MPPITKNTATAAKKATPTPSLKDRVQAKGTEKAKKKVKNHGEGRPVLYPFVDAYTELRKDDDPITVDMAKALLGWAEEPEEEAGEQFGSDYLLKDMKGTKIRCLNNLKNRPLYMSNVLDLMYEHLYKRWKFNFEPIIIGETGLVVNGQHSLISLILAEQVRTGENSAKWYDFWGDSEATMEKMVVYGCPEDDDTINSMDTAKPRSLLDVIYRSMYFRDLPESLRKKAARMADHAIKLLWYRTNIRGGSFKGRDTHGASLQYLNRHPHVLEAVRTILEVDKEGALKEFMIPGHAAAVLFLMGQSRTPDDGDDYHLQAMEGQTDERSLDWADWDRAVKFWQMMGTKPDAKKTKPGDIPPEYLAVKAAFGHIADNDTGTALRNEKLCVLAKAWRFYRDNTEFEKEDIIPERQYSERDEMMVTLDDTDFGGIDRGEPNRRPKNEDTGEAAIEEDGDETPPEVEEMDGPTAADLAEAEVEANFEAEEQELQQDAEEEELKEQPAKATKNGSKKKPAKKVVKDEKEEDEEEDYKPKPKSTGVIAGPKKIKNPDLS